MTKPDRARSLMYLVTGADPRNQWSYSILEHRDVYDRNDQLRTGKGGKLREDLEALARKVFRDLNPGVEIVSEDWRETPATPEEWKEWFNV